MNFLAHAYLSFGNDELIVGNLIADVIRGKQAESFPEDIRAGIGLHRAIDEFTDHHPVVRETKHLLSDSAGRYSGSFLDVAYDHFLAIDPGNTPHEGWKTHAAKAYSAIEKYGDILPPKFCSMYLYMKKEDWLSNYDKLSLIETSFERLTRRTTYLPDDSLVYPDFVKYYEQIEDSYRSFFPDLKKFVLENYF